MKILWITNIALPPVCEAMGWAVPAVGGWMYSSLKKLKNLSNNDFAVATVCQGDELIIKTVDQVRYYLLPLKGGSQIKYNSHLEEIWRKIYWDFQPDVVHIHGSEYPHGLAYVNGVGPTGVVISLQGIISCIARYYALGLEGVSLNRYITFRDIIRHGGIRNEQKSFVKRSKYEIELLSNVDHIIGRTDWDKSHAWAINPKAHYHYCGETLRDAFYHKKWSYEKCEPYSIFVSQASYPIKGLHKLIEAMPLVLRQFPDAKIYAAGLDPTGLPWWRITGYGKYLKRLISELKLKDKIEFTGMLSEEEMCKQYLRANVFVCPSAIENSPNSLGEAQLLGMPYVASFVGGIPEIVEYNPNVLYRFEETEMLAKKICEMFAASESWHPLAFDNSRYDGELNSQLLNDIYKAIVIED